MVLTIYMIKLCFLFCLHTVYGHFKKEIIHKKKIWKRQFELWTLNLIDMVQAYTSFIFQSLFQCIFAWCSVSHVLD